MVGVERARLKGMHFSLFVSNADWAVFNTFLSRVFESQAKECCEVELCKRTNFLVAAAPARSSYGETSKQIVRIEAAASEDRQACLAVMIDISEGKRADEEIRRLNANLERRVEDRTLELSATILQLGNEIQQKIKAQDSLEEEHNLISTILNTAKALIVVLDQADRVVIFNQFCEILTGLKSDDVKGKNFIDLNFIPADEFSFLLNNYTKLKDTPNTPKFYFENSWICQDSKKHLIGWSAAAINGSNGAMEYMVFLGLDLTENRSLRESLRTSEERYRELFMNLPVSTLEVAFKNDKLVIVDANDQALQTYGNLISLNQNSLLSKIFAPDRKKDVENIIKQASRLEKMAFESNHMHMKGEVFPVRINIAFDSKLSSSNYILVIEDITAEKKPHLGRNCDRGGKGQDRQRNP